MIEAELSVLSLSADVLCCHASIDIMQVDSSSGHVNSDLDLFRTKEINLSVIELPVFVPSAVRIWLCWLLLLHCLCL